MATERKAYKDYFDRAAARAMAQQIGAAYPRFAADKFVRSATKNLTPLEFHGRVQQFSDSLRRYLPDDIPKSLRILTDSLPAPLPDCEAVTDGWLQWPLGQFIADHGLNHFDESFAAMIELTQRFSSEFAVRPFVEQHAERTFSRLEGLVDHDSPHVRRWCSEGVRPRLPWGKKLRDLVDNPAPIWPILDALRDDPELYVRRSVANNLNDIGKDHRQLLIKQLHQWSKRSNQKRDWVIRHGLRSLIKAGDSDALKLVGFAPPDNVTVQLKLSVKRAEIGDSIDLTAELKNESGSAKSLMLDYVVHYVRKSGASSAKVFKWKTLTLSAGEQQRLKKKHSFKVTTVRALYPGAHKIELQLNGEIVAAASVELVE